jgi:dipeptidyl aminopeptidase/acylaminoacyl peptidase
MADDEIADSPQLLPDGRGVMFSVRKRLDNWDKGQVVVQPLNGGDRKVLVAGGADGRYLPSGHLAYAVSGIVLAVPVDLATLTVTGGSVPLIEGVRRGAGGAGTTPATAQYAFSPGGHLAYMPGPTAIGSQLTTDLALYDRNGSIDPLRLPVSQYAAPRASPDGKWVAFESADEKNAFVAVHEIGGQTAVRRLTFEGNSRAPIWSPDGVWVAFESDREGDVALFRTRADGAGSTERLSRADKGKTHTPQSWSPDGRFILFSESTGQDVTSSTLWLYSVADKTTSRFNDVAARDAAFSPDGKWVAYGVRDIAGAGNRVFVEPFPRTGARYLLPRIAGHPVWSPKGDELWTNASPSTTEVTAVKATPAFAFGPTQELPRRGRQETSPLTGRRQVDTMPDGRIIGVSNQTVGDQATGNGLIVVLNWFNEVRQRVRPR